MEAIANWEIPTSIQEIGGFIGLTSFFRQSMKYFRKLSASLNKLIRNDSGYTSGPLPKPGLELFK